MERSQVFAMLIAIAAAMLVIIAGKSCANDIEEKNSARRAQNQTTAQYTSEDYGLTPVQPVTESVTAELQPTEPMYEEVTNILGSVVATVPITTVAQEGAEVVTEEVPTTTKSILDSYNEQHTESVSTLPPYPTDDPNRVPNTSTIILELN